MAHPGAKLTVQGRWLLVQRICAGLAASSSGRGPRDLGRDRRVLAAAGVAHERTRPYRPQSNGKVERLNLTLDREWAYARPYRSNQQRLDALPTWLHDYSHHRPHRALDGRSPMQLLNNLPGSHT